MKKRELTVLSFGGGQDSTALLYKIIYDPAFKAKYVKGDLLVIMAQTGNEHEETYKHLVEIEDLCFKHRIKFVLLDYQYTAPGWKGGLVKFYERGNRVGSKAFPKTCSDKLKIDPIYKYLENYVHLNYGTEKVGRKRALKEFAAANGKIDVILGIAKGEEKRAATNEQSPTVWMRETINKVYPLIDEGMDRQACQDYIHSVGHELPVPSACILCPWMNEVELLHLYRNKRAWFDKWVELEHNKIVANAYKGDLTKTMDSKGEIVANQGVWGTTLLPEKIQEVIEKHGHMTDAELEEYRMSHGHCNKSKF